MKKYYGKKRFVPTKCSVCNKSVNLKRHKDWAQLFQDIYSGFNIGMDRYQPGFHGIDRWYSDCRNCSFLKIMSEPSIFSKLLDGGSGVKLSRIEIKTT